MMRREEFLRLHPDIKGEMVAFSSDGEKLGRVKSLNQDSIDIEKGFFFPRDFVIPYDNIIDVKGNEIIIDQRRESLSEWRGRERRDIGSTGSPDTTGYSAAGSSTAGGLGMASEQLARGEEIEIPLREEELEAQKVERQKGEVHLRKVVRTEHRTITIPVTTEEVVVEHTPVTATGTTGELEAGEASFQEEDLTIPIMEEEVELVKHMRLREAVRARKVTHTEQRELSGDVRVEDLEVEKKEGPAPEKHKGI